MLLFKLDEDRLRLLFRLDYRDVAIAFADMEGFAIIDANGALKQPLPVQFGEYCRFARGQGAEPMQDSPGVFSYRLVRRASARKREAGSCKSSVRKRAHKRTKDAREKKRLYMKRYNNRVEVKVRDRARKKVIS